MGVRSPASRVKNPESALNLALVYLRFLPPGFGDLEPKLFPRAPGFEGLAPKDLPGRCGLPPKLLPFGPFRGGLEPNRLFPDSGPSDRGSRY
jgi:hypothetical protein